MISSKIFLEPGKQSIVVRYYDIGGGAALSLAWGSAKNQQIMKLEALTPE